MEKTLTIKLPKLHFPWLSFTVIVLICIALVIRVFLEELYFEANWLESLLRFESPLWIVVLTIALSFDVYKTVQQNNKIRNSFFKIKSELDLAWKQKAKQQDRANTFSGQKDKLKSFISDKLLEFMEYDEKFVHFKGIAAEVRHNGVISYDKVTTALEKAIEQQGFLEMYESKDSAHSQNVSTQTLESLSLYQNAQDAMEYLWALLDLSTADNMALHIGKQLIECEEHFFQLKLDSDKKMELTQSIPLAPTFPPQLSLLLTISLQSDETEIRNLISLSRINHQVFQEAFEFENDTFKLFMAPTAELLGNPNHIILLLENLIKNALFFAKKPPQKQASDRVIIQLRENNSTAQFYIYNRGPNIAEEDFAHIFNLGFSTRRNRKHNGKGLGLFFSKQIVDGYQGEIEASNISGNQSWLKVIIDYEAGESKSYLFRAKEVDGDIGLMLDESKETLAHFELDCEMFLSRISLSILTDEKENITASISLSGKELNQNASRSIVLEDQSLIPLWKVKLNADKKAKKPHKISIHPLRISGVAFTVSIPTAESLLDE